MFQSYEIEQALIGLAIQDADCAERVAQLPEDTFSFPDNVELHGIIKALVSEHTEVSMVTVGVRSNHAANIMVCAQRAADLMITPAQYAQTEITCLDMRRRRRISAACQKAVELAGDSLEDVDKITADLVQAVNDNSGQPEGISMDDATMGFLEDLSSKGGVVKTGLCGLDNLVGGLQKGMLAILGARPKVGKTAMALSMATYAARHTGPVLMVSLEMTPKEIITRMMSADTGIDMHKIVTKDLTEDEWLAITKNSLQLKKLPVRFTDARTPLQIRRDAASMKRDGGLSMIVVDYIQLLRSDDSKKSRYEEVSSISRELKLLAMDLDVPVLALTQFNRESERFSRKPTMAEARDSGSIEQDANIFMIQYPIQDPQPGSEIYAYWMECQEMGTELQVLEVAANRQGPTGGIMVAFDKPRMRFATFGRKE